MSPLLSAPQTLQRFLLSRDPKPKPNVRPRVPDISNPFVFASKALLTLSAASAAAFSWAILSASRAASSASGESGMVSKLEILGLRDRVDVGVEGTEDDAKEPG